MSAFERWLPHLPDLKSFNVWSVLKSSFGPLERDAARPNVCFWPKADMPKNAIDVAIGGKRTWAGAVHMSAFDPKRTSTERYWGQIYASPYSRL